MLCLFYLSFPSLFNITFFFSLHFLQHGMFGCYFCSLSLVGFLPSDALESENSLLLLPLILEDDEPLSPSLSYGNHWHFKDLVPVLLLASCFLSLGAESFLSVSLEIKLFCSWHNDYLFSCSDLIPASGSSGWNNQKQKKPSFFLPDSKTCKDTGCGLERYKMRLISQGPFFLRIKLEA